MLFCARELRARAHSERLRRVPAAFLSLNRWISIDEGRVLAECGQVVVEVVPIELGLDGIASEAEIVLFEFFIVLVLPLFVDVFLVKVVFLGWDEWSDDFPVQQVLPREIFKPGVGLDLGGPVKAETIRRFPLDHLLTMILTLYLLPCL